MRCGHSVGVRLIAGEAAYIFTHAQFFPHGETDRAANPSRLDRQNRNSSAFAAGTSAAG